jgi:hypothetical protein
LGSRYGSIEPISKYSYTEFEYRYAVDKGKPVFTLVLSQDAIDQKIKKLKSKAVDNPGKLEEFRKFVMTRMVEIVKNTDQIKLAIITGIPALKKHNNLSGWARTTRDSKIVTTELARLTAENASLRQDAAKKPANSSELDIEQWKATLKSIAYISIKDYIASLSDQNYKSKPYSLLQALIAHSAELASGVANSSMDNTPSSRWLYSMAKQLLPLGLTEFGRVPPTVQWTRIQLSKEGKQLVIALRHAAAAAPAADQVAPVLPAKSKNTSSK